MGSAASIHAVDAASMDELIEREVKDPTHFVKRLVSSKPFAADFSGPPDLTNDDIKEIRAQAEINDLSGLGPRLLVLDEQVDPHDVLINATLPSTLIVSYNSQEDTAAELVGMIRIAHLAEGKPFRSIAFANHGGEVWQLAVDCKASMGDSSITIATAQPVLSALVAALASGGRIDLLGCNLLELDPELVTNLETFYDKNFAASDDKTGNIVGGGNWIMESDNIDVCACYFDKTKVAEYKEVMWSFWDTVDCVPVVGAGARIAQAGVCLAKGDAEGAKDAAANAALNAAGDALGLVTGGSGKVAMIAARTGAKIVVKQGAKAAGKKMVKIGMKHISKKLSTAYAKKYFKKKIKSSVKREFKKMLKEANKERDDIEDMIAEATGCDLNALRRLPDEKLMELASAIADAPGEYSE